MDILQTVVLGIVQGVGEFLPISSSANLAVISKICHFADCSFETKIALHVGSLLALIFYFRQILWKILLGIFTKKVKLSQTVFYTMVIATLPVVIIGGILHHFIKNFDSNTVTGFLLIMFGILLWQSDTLPKNKSMRHCKKTTHTEDNLIISILQPLAKLPGVSRLRTGILFITFGLFMWLCETLQKNKLMQRCIKSTYIRDIIIGIFQSLAILPGVSRLGICTTACRLCNVSRKQAINLSLLLAIPSIAGSLCIELLTIVKNNSMQLFSGSNLIGMMISATVGIIALPICVKYMENRGFFGLMCYRIILGFIVIFML